MVMTMARRRVFSYYDSLAPLYDKLATKDTWQPNSRLLPLLASCDSPEVFSQVVDVGSGTGQTIEALRSRFDVPEVVCIEPSAGMAQKLRERTRKGDEIIQLPLEVYLQGDCEALRRASLVTAIGCLEFLPNALRALSTIGVALRKGAILALTIEPPTAGSGQDRRRETFHQPDGGTLFTVYRRTRDEVRQAMAGLEELSVDEFVAYERLGHPVTYNLMVWRKQ